ncbi:hypothetical protein B0H17DRAFT_1145188 [Mycena rosella]|uniref:Uncharacterized protein n=1 Tax=Mycena rosella TaxID=1033263 RepID=A0AAD7CRJ2_MYCRO|nr:hypothetical protein B0H17DRAFT_1145188 [Mycena rosella]
MSGNTSGSIRSRALMADDSYTDLHRPTQTYTQSYQSRSVQTFNSTSINIKPLGAADHWRAAHVCDIVSMKVGANHIVACIGLGRAEGLIKFSGKNGGNMSPTANTSRNNPEDRIKAVNMCLDSSVGVFRETTQTYGTAARTFEDIRLAHTVRVHATTRTVPYGPLAGLCTVTAGPALQDIVMARAKPARTKHRVDRHADQCASVLYSYSGIEYEYDMNIFEYILVIDWSKNPHPNQPTTSSYSFLVGPNVVNLEPSDPTGGQEITKSGGLAHPNIGIRTF